MKRAERFGIQNEDTKKVERAKRCENSRIILFDLREFSDLVSLCQRQQVL